MSHLLTLNAGSSSLKFALYATATGDPVPRAVGKVERIGSAPVLSLKDSASGRSIAKEERIAATSHAGALQAALAALEGAYPSAKVRAVGHRVVHGGRKHSAPALLTPEVITDLDRLSPFAPLHQPHNLAGVRAAVEAFPEALQVACFDTAFHRSHPFVNDTFALPKEYYDKGVRRYGFHGLSYDYITGVLDAEYPDLHEGRVAVAHLGNGASLCAIRQGRSLASTMGFSALDGLPMGTRSGQLDPGVVLYMLQQEKLSPDRIAEILYTKSGLAGISGISHDMRDLLDSDSTDAKNAVDYFTFRIRRELGAMAAALEGLDGIVFCGGIGENAAPVRQMICDPMGWLGVSVDPKANAANAREIGTGKIRVLVIPTDEEIVIARAAAALL
ncbi:acetate/propionate family kinase [Pseudooceanicola nanhaiensis]|uniref:acetate/propionate family kinase n=1 Tax=Pseudooceanicola nanhaiensis TaxID=375761 RepID=UPI001CD3BFAE|nr:acetate/propionate family kinase [Pseudooceanicola nanhaiensis]MCA0922232.1 acetate/propionate family kinase [Pseudooceanicola nanhaiensis]